MIYEPRNKVEVNTHKDIRVKNNITFGRYGKTND